MGNLPVYSTAFAPGKPMRDSCTRCWPVGHADKMGYIEYRCLHCGEGTHRVEHSPLAVGRRAVFDAVEQKFGGSRTA